MMKMKFEEDIAFILLIESNQPSQYQSKEGVGLEKGVYAGVVDGEGEVKNKKLN